MPTLAGPLGVTPGALLHNRPKATETACLAREKGIRDAIKSLNANPRISPEVKHLLSIRYYQILDMKTLRIEAMALEKKYRQALERVRREGTNQGADRQAVFAPVKKLAQEYIEVDNRLWKMQLASCRLVLFAPWREAKPLSRWIEVFNMGWLLWTGMERRVRYVYQRLWLAYRSFDEAILFVRVPVVVLLSCAAFLTIQRT